MTWLGIANTCLYKVPQLTVHVRANSKPWGQRSYLQTSETGLCQGIDLEKGREKSLQLYRSQRAQWPPSFVNGRSLEPPRIFLDLAARPNWAIGEDGPWRWGVSRTPRVTLTERQHIFVETGEPFRRSTIQATLHQSGLYGRVAKRRPFLSKRHMTARWEFAKQLF